MNDHFVQDIFREPSRLLAASSGKYDLVLCPAQRGYLVYRGYLKLWRKIEDSGLLQIPNTYALFTFLLLKAAHKPKKIGTPHGIVNLQRGEYISGRLELARALNQSERQVRTSLDRLIKMEILTIKPTSRYSIYTIVKYEDYQTTEQQATSQTPTDDQQTTNRRPTDDQQATTKQELKELKNVKKEKNKPIVSDFADTELQNACKETWQKYCNAYFNRYGTEPIRNAGVNSMVKQFVQKLGFEDSPFVAEFFVLHNDRFYVQKTHPVSLMSKDAEGLRTQWATGRSMTATRAGQIDKTQANYSVVGEAMRILEEQKNAKTA